MKRRLSLCMIVIFVPLLLALAEGISRQSFALSMEMETQRVQTLEAMIHTEMQAAVEGLGFDALQQAAAQFENTYTTRQSELMVLYHGYPLGGGSLPAAYAPLLTGARAAMLDARSAPEHYVIADALNDEVTIVLLQDVSDLYTLRARLRRSFWLWGLGGGAAVVGLSLLIAGWLIRPVKQLTRAVRQLAQADGAPIALLPPRRDELGVLSQSFQEMQLALRQRETALQQEAAGRQALLEALAHEMRTPLCALLGDTRLLENAAATPRQREAALARMAHEMKRLAGMDEQLLKLVDLRHADIEKKQVPVLALLRDTAQRLQPQAGGVTLRVQGEEATLWGDEALLTLMADNLAVNALRASQPGQQVVLQANADGFSVMDEGIGMNPEQLAKAFEPFYKGDKARARSAGGAGLGLCLCRRIAQLHGGTLQLSSVPGQGTTARWTTSLQPVADLVTTMEVPLPQEVEHP